TASRFLRGGEACNRRAVSGAAGIGRAFSGHVFTVRQPSASREGTLASRPHGPYDATMRVLFDGFWWVRGPVSNRQVLREFIFAWTREFPDDDVVVAVRRRDHEVARSQLPATVGIVGTRLSPQGIS